MPLQISGKSIDIGDALRHHIQSRISAIINKYYNGTYTGHVILSSEGAHYRTECIIHLNSGMDLQSESTDLDIYASFDNASDKFEKRMARYKERTKSHTAQGHKKFYSAPSYIVQNHEDDSEGYDEASDGAPIIIAEMKANIRTITVREAVLDLDISGAPVLVFKNASNNNLNVVYKRSDGNISWIDPSLDQ